MTGAAWLSSTEDDVTRSVAACRIQPGQLEQLNPPAKGGDTDA
jgi:hypothetical protein